MNGLPLLPLSHRPSIAAHRSGQNFCLAVRRQRFARRHEGLSVTAMLNVSLSEEDRPPEPRRHTGLLTPSISVPSCKAGAQEMFGEQTSMFITARGNTPLVEGFSECSRKSMQHQNQKSHTLTPDRADI